MTEKITLNLVEYKNGDWGFVGHIPEPLRVVRVNSVNQQFTDSKHFQNERDAVHAAVVAGFDVRVYRVGAK